MNDEEQMRKMVKDGLLGRRLYGFAEESDLIEGIIDGDETRDHANRLHTLVFKDNLHASDLCQFNANYMLRSAHGMNVIVGGHTPPEGGPHIFSALDDVVAMANEENHPFDVHCAFEDLHPFLDGNGRTGRALWLWQMVNQHGYRCEGLFLRKWYYQSLDRGRP